MSHRRHVGEEQQHQQQQHQHIPLNVEDFSSDSELLDGAASNFLSNVLGCNDEIGSNDSISSVSNASAIQPEANKSRQKDDKKKPAMKGKKKVAKTWNHTGRSKMAPPKRARSPYVMYLKSGRRDKKWTELTREEKREYIKLARADEQRYVTELERYNQKLQEEVSHLRDKMTSPPEQDDSSAEEVSTTDAERKAVATLDNFSHNRNVATSVARMPAFSTLEETEDDINRQISNHRHLSRLLDQVQNNRNNNGSRNTTLRVNGEGGEVAAATLPLPPGLEINLRHGPNMREQRYQIQYNCVTMTMEQATQYIQNNLGGGSLPPPPSSKNK